MCVCERERERERNKSHTNEEGKSSTMTDVIKNEEGLEVKNCIMMKGSTLSSRKIEQS